MYKDRTPGYSWDKSAHQSSGISPLCGDRQRLSTNVAQFHAQTLSRPHFSNLLSSPPMSLKVQHWSTCSFSAAVATLNVRPIFLGAKVLTPLLTHIASSCRYFPFSHGTSVRSSGRLPSAWLRPSGSRYIFLLYCT